MKVNVNYFDSKFLFNKEYINVIEIENRSMFYRFIKDLCLINNEGCLENIQFYEEEKNVNMSNKIKVIIDYFDFQFESKKYVNDVSKYVGSLIEEEDRNVFNGLYNKIIKQYKKILNNIDVPLIIEEDFNIDSLNKLIKISIDSNNELIDNLFLVIDFEKVLKLKRILVFVNLKQYLSKDELIELYKYAIYNEVDILLVDSQSYGISLKYEKKYIIDENLDEFVL